MSAVAFKTEDENGDEVEHELPAKYEVCDRCRGEGSHVNPSIGAITSSEWADDWDDESREDYMRGAYDVPCDECNGARVVLVVDENSADKEVLALYHAQQRSDAESRANDAYWARVESGGRE